MDTRSMSSRRRWGKWTVLCVPRGKTNKQTKNIISNIVGSSFSIVLFLEMSVYIDINHYFLLTFSLLERLRVVSNSEWFLSWSDTKRFNVTLVLDTRRGGRRPWRLQTNIFAKTRLNKHLDKKKRTQIGIKLIFIILCSSTHLSIDVGNFTTNDNSLDSADNFHPSEGRPLGLWEWHGFRNRPFLIEIHLHVGVRLGTKSKDLQRISVET